MRIATPEMREGRRERLLERLREASPAERRRVLRRERRIMRFLPEEERRAIQLENRRFRKEHGIGSPRLRRARDAIRQLGFSAEEGRLLRARLHKLPKKERQELRRQIMNVRELPEAERELLRERLDEMKSLSEDEERAFRERARRWEEMPEERRDKLRLQMKRLRELPADERIELLERVLDASEGEGDES
ncbi:MAG: DUF3106 domain-containing protein [bacterium]|nr:DUF3106 domain-containing protein [bacterium]